MSFPKATISGNPCGLSILFFAFPKKRIKRKGSPAAETTPFAEVQNRRGKNSLRSNSLPLHPVPHPAARLSGKGPVIPGYIFPGKEHPGGANIENSRGDGIVLFTDHAASMWLKPHTILPTHRNNSG